MGKSGLLMFPQKRRWFTIVLVVLLLITSITFIHNDIDLNLLFYTSKNLKILPNVIGTISFEEKRQTVKVCCLVLTTPSNFLTRAKAVNETWGKRCDGLYFITEMEKKSMSTYDLPIAPIPNIISGYWHLTLKSRLAFIYAYENLYSKYDWFIKADDDTYIIVEHLKDFLYEQNASQPITFGYNFKVLVKQGYHSGGASYVLSKESLKRFFEETRKSNSVCKVDGGSEDVEIAACLRLQGVYPGDALDKENKELFHPLNFIAHFAGKFPEWMFSYAKYPLQSMTHLLLRIIPEVEM
ncbi:unnamed protein product [Didymodactylos carnosus]|uniref:N-acetylgalactosaminide beta-1,3-galactosyltransferase n=1 Tax=Didymodactylos carnosus TaxID=1234261 RepID=A0A814V683_9BILA|nr:unnamed protein product [Didymodactylos carnosus]CAF1237143.1 unnamed protein product [Didymodactylos carnosus]CAF3949035.1 unnamed protein product [Didymodactylos carnosus]CAF4044738.1 unnamed protein product [Didymodactylos carnosus]